MILQKERVTDKNGNVTVVALMILVILTLIGLLASRTSSTDILLAGSLIPYKQDFFIAEGGQSREASEIGAGNYPITNIDGSGIELSYNGSEELPHKVLNETYNSKVEYGGYHFPPKGYSIIRFSRYDYIVKTSDDSKSVNINSRYYKIGPKPE